MGIRRISLEEAREIEKERLPLGNFMIDKKIDGKYVGICNETGDAQVGRFDSKKQLKRWLYL